VNRQADGDKLPSNRYNHIMPEPLSLDAQAHLDLRRTSQELSGAGAVLAMTLSLDEAEKVEHREEPLIAWGVGCHARKLAVQQAIDPLHLMREARSLSPSAYGVFGVVYNG
jgi:hypothetical protein